MTKPDGVFDRDREWAALERLQEPTPGRLQFGVVWGRRRYGKSFLLRHLAREHGGFYHQALELDRQPALDRYAASLSGHLSLPASLQFHTWEAAIRATVSSPGAPLVVLDEFPYLLRSAPELASVLQLAVDDAASGGPGGRIVVCGSSLSVMAGLLSGAAPLRGRAVLDLVLDAFDYRTAARYWGLDGDARAAFAVDAVLGGAPGYRDLMRGAVPVLREPSGGAAGAFRPAADEGFREWLGTGPLDPAHALFSEDDFLLREEARITDRSQYLSVLSAIAGGAATSGAIASRVGRDARSLHHSLGVLEQAGFVERADDLLQDRRPIYRLRDPIVRFSRLVTKPEGDRLERGDWAAVLADRAHALDAGVFGPHFEHLAREFVARFASATTIGGTAGAVGSAVVPDANARRSHEIDVVAIDSTSNRRPNVAAIGEAKFTAAPRTVGDLLRLERARELVVATRGERFDASSIRLLLFSANGFDAELTAAAQARSDLELIDLERLYGGE
ncbi:MAG: ATP-binding protein [Acidimicrobiia bacterium]